jgi:signal transduction histidine kinase
MKHSLKIWIFINVLMLALAILAITRPFAERFLGQQLSELAHTEMATVLARCPPEIGQADAFYNCQRQIEPFKITSILAHQYVLCPAAGHTPEMSGRTAGSTPAPAPASECAGAQGSAPGPASAWTGVRLSVHPGIEMGLFAQDPHTWMGVRQVGQPSAAVLLLKPSAVTDFMRQMWAFRDRNSALTLPIIVALLVLCALYLTYVLMKALKLLEKALSDLNVRNLDLDNRLKAPYREFKPLVQVFEDLRRRLKDNFDQTRRFVADASHELKTPLTIMRGNAQQLIHDVPLDSPFHRPVQKINEEVERLIDITEKLLLLSQADAQNLRFTQTSLNFSAFLEDLLSDGLPEDSGLTLTSEIQGDVNWLCEPTLIRQLVHNLYANALKYNIPGGWIHLELRASSERLTLRISNSAKDLPSDLSQRAFDRFYRGQSAHSRKKDGQGLGLSIAQEIARVHQAPLSMVCEDHQVTVTLQATL